MSNRAFIYVTPSELRQRFPDMEQGEFEHYVKLSRLPDRKCDNCDEPVWKYADLDMCFSCVTGESDASGDFELLPEPETQHPVVYRYKNWDVKIILSHYADDLRRSAIQLVAAATEHNEKQGVYPNEPIATATVNIPLAPLQHEQTLIKSWSENEGMLEWLYTHNLVEPTGQSVQCGFVSADVVWLTQKLGDVAEIFE